MRGMHVIRRLAKGMPGMLLAALMLFARLVAPAAAMPRGAASDVAEFALQTICHTGASGERPGETDHSPHLDCLLCPACHLVSHAVLPTPAAPTEPSPPVSVIAVGAALPPATAPPSRVRATAQPTGPPRLSA